MLSDYSVPQMWGFLFKTYSYICCASAWAHIQHINGSVFLQETGSFFFVCVSSLRSLFPVELGTECSVDSLMVKLYIFARACELVTPIVSEFVSSFCQNQLNWASTQLAQWLLSFFSESFNITGPTVVVQHKLTGFAYVEIKVFVFAQFKKKIMTCLQILSKWRQPVSYWNYPCQHTVYIVFLYTVCIRFLLYQ